MDKVNSALRWWNGTRLGRMLARYSIQRGALMSGGIAYSALFSIGAALTIAWTILMAILGGDKALMGQVVKNVNQAMPGLLSTPQKDGLINPDNLVMDSSFSVAGVIAIITLIFAATRVMANLKISLRSMFGIARYPDNFLIEKLRDILGFLILGVGVLLTTILGVVVSSLGSTILDFIGLSGQFAQYSLKIASLLVAALVDGFVWCTLIAFVSGIKVPRKDLLLGGAMFGVFSGIVRYLGTTAVGSVHDPLLASFAALATLMLWVNLLARVTQMVAAWTANPPSPAVPTIKDELHLNDRPNYVSLSAPNTLAWPHQTMTGSIDTDPTLDPKRPEPEPEREPYWGGLVGKLKAWRISRLQRKISKAQDRL
ncbi:hypothetical protein BK816_06420 [Boudabousia tangfeifanii]|uniref:Uncharacterized protein n=2 Tax=Boudabousia tangfeifanii TaxID=1912795 RepID=A0A1D9MMU4_9ACTO|nr:hypothetical protein BK816_06420 [Boudabousia tangfeifanii]